MEKSAILVSSLALLFVAETESTISCYACSSRNGSNVNCEDPFHPALSVYTTECMDAKEGHKGTFPANFCIKLIGVSYVTQETLVIRMCKLENMENQCGVFRYGSEEFRGCILTCNYDGCNAATTTSVTSTTLLYWLTILLLCRSFTA